MLKSNPGFERCNTLSVDNHQFYSGEDDVLAQCISIYPSTAMEHEIQAIFATNPSEEEEYRAVSLATTNHVFWRVLGGIPGILETPTPTRSRCDHLFESCGFCTAVHDVRG